MRPARLPPSIAATSAGVTRDRTALPGLVATLIVLLWTGAIGGMTVVDSLRLGLVIAGAIGAVGGVAGFLLLGPDDPVRTVWYLRDERPATGDGREAGPA
jgi:hypothetical protein